MYNVYNMYNVYYKFLREGKLDATVESLAIVRV